MKFNKILHPIFIFSLILLLLNDFYLKAFYSNELTGKLSDFTGLFVFAVFFSQVIPKSKKWISLITGLLFIVWKTPIVTPLIDLFNQYAFYKIQRVVDYSDYLALLVLPFAHRFIKNEFNFKLNLNVTFLRVSQYFILGFSVFAICATSYPNKFKPKTPDGTVYIGKKYTIKKSKEKIIESLQNLGFNPIYYHSNNNNNSLWMYDHYQSDTIITNYDHYPFADTILNVKYRLIPMRDQSKTKLEIINVTFNTDEPIQQIKTLRRLKNEYKHIIKDIIVDKLE
ncbi:MAG: hypothetical protein ACPGSD_15550 [Flavobacteriales bacterium]